MYGALANKGVVGGVRIVGEEYTRKLQEHLQKEHDVRSGTGLEESGPVCLHALIYLVVRAEGAIQPICARLHLHGASPADYTRGLGRRAGLVLGYTLC